MYCLELFVVVYRTLGIVAAVNRTENAVYRRESIVLARSAGRECPRHCNGPRYEPLVGVTG
jgi:hypothetical protein